MKFFFLAWAGLWRKPTRTLFTVISLAVGFLLFGLLQGVNSTFMAAIGRTKADRLLIDPRFDRPLPQSYASRIADVPGVRDVTWTQFLQGFYRDQRNFVLVLTAEPTSFFRVRDEYVTSEATLRALTETRTGLVILDKLAEQYGWKVGDKVTLTANVPRRDGGNDWEFEVVGLMTCPSNPGQFPFAVANFGYLDGARAVGQGTVGRFVIRVTEPGRSVEVGRAIDAEFANSPAPTLSQLEDAFAGTQLATIGDVGRLTVAVIAAVFFAILFLAGNVILQSVRERTAEFAVLKTLGFSDGRVLGLVVLESLLLCGLGAALGLAASQAVFPFVAAFLPNLSLYLATTPQLSASVVVLGVGVAAVLTVLAGALPAWRAKRLKIVEALRMSA
jgi:putative ABC transport system permease protein